MLPHILVHEYQALDDAWRARAEDASTGVVQKPQSNPRAYAVVTLRAISMTGANQRPMEGTDKTASAATEELSVF
jgi:hypothetical protein